MGHDKCRRLYVTRLDRRFAMKKKKDLCVAWKPETLRDRLQRCMSMLHIHGMISDAEYRKALARLAKKFYLENNFK